jgi:hypothetical protein
MQKTFESTRRHCKQTFKMNIRFRQEGKVLWSSAHDTLFFGSTTLVTWVFEEKSMYGGPNIKNTNLKYAF